MAGKENTAAGSGVTTEERISIIRKASWIGISGNLFLAALKIVSGFLFSSFALIGDGIDSLTDVVTSSVTLVTAGISSRPPDREHPYGHGRAETIATKLLSFIILFAGAQLAVSAVRKIFVPSESRLPDLMALVVIAVSILVKLFLAFYKKRAGLRAKSSMLIADARNMRNDVLISISVLAGLLFTVFLNLPVLDAITALLVSFWIMYTGFSIFMETSRELMDGVDDPGMYAEVFDIVNSIPGTGNPHKTRIRKLNNVYIIDMDIEVDGKLSVSEGHNIAMLVEKTIKGKMENIYDIQVHVEPTGNYEQKEIFGLSENLLNGKE